MFLTDVTLGYLDTSEYPAKGLINANEDYIVIIRVENNSSSNVTINFGISYGLESGGDLTLEANQYWLDIIRSGILLNEVEPGSYVAYTGNNGCTGASCTGQNANYVDDTDMGYCVDFNYKFKVNGWRIGYIKDNTAYLTSAGATECYYLIIKNCRNKLTSSVISFIMNTRW